VEEMDITYREIIAGVLLFTFLFILLLPTDFMISKQGSSEGLIKIPVSNPILNILGASFSIQFDNEKDEILYGRGGKIDISSDTERTVLNKASGSIIIGIRELKNINISAASVLISGVLDNVFVDISSVNVTSKNLLIKGPVKIKISTATIKGELYIDEFSSDGKVEIIVDSASTNLTVYVKKGYENKVSVQGTNIIVKNW
jgi:hypothetical protein